MSTALDMSLDDLIKNNKRSRGNGGGGGGGGSSRGRGRGGGRSSGPGPGPARRLPNRRQGRPTPYSMAKDASWAHSMVSDQVVAGGGAYPGMGGRSSAMEAGAKLYVSNLDYGVSNEDIKELFSEFGDLKRYSIHYDRSRRSKGTAEVVFSRRSDAIAAVKRYDNVQLDGKPMKIEIVGGSLVPPAVGPMVTNGVFGNQNGFPRRNGGQRRGGAIGRLRGGAAGGGRSSGRGRGRGRGRGHGENVSVDDLDADLEKYHSEAMQIN